MLGRLFAAVAAITLVISVMAAHAQGTPSVDARDVERDTAISEAMKAALHGPTSISLLDQGTFDLSAGMIFIPQPEASRLVRASGNTVGSGFLGLVLGPGNWSAYLSFSKDGFIEDSDAKEWKADDLLQNLKAVTEEGNVTRLAGGFPALDVTGWIEQPLYASSTHRLVWSLGVRERGTSATGTVVNYKTYLLGREGLFALNFVTAADQIENEKVIARQLLANLQFSSGKRYEDVDRTTDRIATYGLAALVGGVALKKVGFFAVAVAFALKFAKAGVLLVIAFVGGVARYFRRRKPTA